MHLILAPSIQINVFFRKRGFHLEAVPKKSPGDIGKRGTPTFDLEEIAWWMQTRKAGVNYITPIDVVHPHHLRFAHTHPEVEFDKLTQNHVDLVIEHTLGVYMREAAARFIRRYIMWLSKKEGRWYWIMNYDGYSIMPWPSTENAPWLRSLQRSYMSYASLAYGKNVSSFGYVMHKNHGACLGASLMALFEGKSVPFMIFFKILLTVGAADLSLKKILHAGLRMAGRGSASLRAGLRTRYKSRSAAST